MKYIIYGYLFAIAFLFSSGVYATDSSNFSSVQTPQKTDKPKIQLASRYHREIQVDHFLVSEKLDGVRARWNGEHLVTRGGHVINAPDWFTHDFPKRTLDGELWIGRNRFDEVSAVVRKKNIDGHQWKLITFNVFDLPLSREPFSQRYQILQQLLNSQSSPYISLIIHKTVPSNTVLNQWLNEIEEKRGEGLMLHHKESVYEHKRSKNLLKLKKVYDAEAVVISHINGKGKFKGMLGAMLMEKPNGIRFKLGSGFSDALRRNPPPVGTTVTYQYYGLTKNGKPRFASYLRIRRQHNDK